MKVGYLIPEYPGQTHSFFWREMKSLAQYDIHTKVISTRLPAQPVHHDWTREISPEYLFPLSVREMFSLVPALPHAIACLAKEKDSRNLLRHPKIWVFVALALRLNRICEAEGIDHLHVHSCANAALIAALLNRFSGLPYSLVLHGPVSDYGPYQDFKWHRASFGFVITDRLRSEITRLLPGLPTRLSIVPMGVDTDTFVPNPEPRLRNRTQPWRWFSCGRLNPVKGVDTLIAAARIITQSPGSERFQILIAGEDEQGGSGYRKQLEELLQESGLGEHVRLLGAVTQERVQAELQHADGFVLASRHEPLGVAYMEAMSCALPTIGTDAGGVRELITDNVDGLLVPAEDPEALAKAMIRVMHEPELCDRLGHKARNKIIDGFSADRSAKALKDALTASLAPPLQPNRKT